MVSFVWIVENTRCPVIAACIAGYTLIEIDLRTKAWRRMWDKTELVRINGSYNPVTGAQHHVRIDMVGGFEYELAEIGRGWTKTTGPIKFDLTDSYGQFADIHLCQNGIVH